MVKLPSNRPSSIDDVPRKDTLTKEENEKSLTRITGFVLGKVDSSWLSRDELRLGKAFQQLIESSRYHLIDGNPEAMDLISALFVGAEHPIHRYLTSWKTNKGGRLNAGLIETACRGICVAAVEAYALAADVTQKKAIDVISVATSKHNNRPRAAGKILGYMSNAGALSIGGELYYQSSKRAFENLDPFTPQSVLDCFERLYNNVAI